MANKFEIANFNTVSFIDNYHQMMFESSPRDVEFPKMDENGNIKTVKVPNRSKLIKDFDNWKTDFEKKEVRLKVKSSGMNAIKQHGSSYVMINGKKKNMGRSYGFFVFDMNKNDYEHSSIYDIYGEGLTEADRLAKDILKYYNDKKYGDNILFIIVGHDEPHHHIMAFNKDKDNRGADYIPLANVMYYMLDARQFADVIDLNNNKVVDKGIYAKRFYRDAYIMVYRKNHGVIFEKCSDSGRTHDPHAVVTANININY